MKDKIMEVLHKHDQDPHGVDMSSTRRINADAAADDLTALMCYREARALSIGYGGISEEMIIAYLKKYEYLEPTILAAIEQLKKD